MSLALNTRFGPYLLAESIGVGGMGEVYRATDTNLKRDVAIKVLPASFSADPDRLARFQREAEVLAALNHVNIAHIYGLERSGGVTALVMELVDGQTLAERLERGALSADEALNIALQIAEALEAAHERGIVHRDLKPANIKLASNGVVKVLDFGIAKALDTKTISGPQPAQLTTPAMTEAGIVLGTAAYMSPEQARGKAVDQRADIWAFGCVLYEMLTGQTAFGGEDVTTTLARILERSPDMNTLPHTLSPVVKHTLRLCLEKDPRKRIRHIGDVKLALAGTFVAPELQTKAAGTGARSSSVIAWSICALAILAAGALAIPFRQHLREKQASETRLEIVTPATDDPVSFALSPDGSQIVFVASGEGESRLWLRNLSSTSAQALAGTEGAVAPFWSPDGKSLGFFAKASLKRLDLGGVPQTLASTINGQGGTWNAEGVIVYAPSRTTSLLRISAAGGNAVEATTLGLQHQGHLSPHFLPDGRHYLFFIQGPPDTVGIYLGTLDGGDPIRLTPASSPGVHHPSGRLLWVRDGTLLSQTLDVESGVLTGEPLALADGLFVDSTLNKSAFGVASTGQIAYRVGASSLRQLTWLDRSGTELATLGEPDPTYIQTRLSPDGRRVVLSREVQGNRDLWMVDSARTSRLTFDGAQEQFPVWSPDGTRIVFRSNRTNAGDIYEMPADSAGGEQRIVEATNLISPSSWSADGRFLMYLDINPVTGADIKYVSMEGDRPSYTFRQTPFREVYGEFSPDGRWVAYHSNESGSLEVYVRPFIAPGSATPAAGAQWQVSTAGGIYPLWGRDGKELYYLNPDGDMMEVPITANGASMEPGVPVKLFATRILNGGVDVQQGRQYDIAPDGRFLINAVLDDTDTPITLIQNWNPEATQ